MTTPAEIERILGENTNERFGCDPLDGPVFTRRNEERYQVRFWSTLKDYEAFTKAVRAEDLVIQDVFNELMIWFTNAHHSKNLHIQPVLATLDAGEPLERGCE